MVQEKPMKAPKAKKESARIRLPRKGASHAELSDFFDRHDGVDLLDRGIVEVDPDHEDLERMLLEYWSQPNTKQLNIRILATAKRMIERLAKRKTIEASTLVRMWVIECMRREAMQPLKGVGSYAPRAASISAISSLDNRNSSAPTTPSAC